MKTEYMFTEQQKAELAEIDHQIAELCMRKVDIYICAPIRYITETSDEYDAVNKLYCQRLYGITPVINKNCIAKLVFEDKE